MAARGAEVLRRASVIALLAALAAAIAAGCGVEELSPGAAVAEAATATADAGSSRAEFTFTMTSAALPEPLTMRGRGIFDSKERIGRMTFDLSELGERSGVDLGKAEMVFEGLVVYMKLPFLSELQPGLKPWIKLDLQAIAKQQGLDLAGLQQLSASDPSQTLAYLRAVGDDVEDLGGEHVRGVETTHYRATVELEHVADQAPEAQRERVRASIRQLIEKSGVERVATEVWVDDKGLVRRMKLEYEGIELAPGQKGAMTMTMELFDFGVEVDVEPPPADQVMTLRELLRAGGQS